MLEADPEPAGSTDRLRESWRAVRTNAAAKAILTPSEIKAKTRQRISNYPRFSTSSKFKKCNRLKVAKSYRKSDLLEVRRPKSEIRKAGRSPNKTRTAHFSDFDIRPALRDFGFRISAFGFRRFTALCPLAENDPQTILKPFLRQSPACPFLRINVSRLERCARPSHTVTGHKPLRSAKSPPYPYRQR